MGGATKPFEYGAVAGGIVTRSSQTRHWQEGNLTLCILCMQCGFNQRLDSYPFHLFHSYDREV